MEITHDQANQRYVLEDNGEYLGKIEYEVEGTTLLLLTAEVPIDKRGKGLGVPLTSKTLDHIRQQGSYSVTPICPYIAKYMLKNPEYDDLRK